MGNFYVLIKLNTVVHYRYRKFLSCGGLKLLASYIFTTIIVNYWLFSTKLMSAILSGINFHFRLFKICDWCFFTSNIRFSISVTSLSN